jgi:hypothetical protein
MGNKLKAPACALVVAVFSAGPGYAEPGTVAAIGAATIKQVAEFTKMIAHMKETLANAKAQLSQLKNAEDIVKGNLRGLLSSHTWDDFGEWRDWDAYLSNEAEKYFREAGVEIGGKKWSLAEVSEIPELMKNGQPGLFTNEFTPAEIKRMWLEHGMSPDNYVWAELWRKRGEEAEAKILHGTQIANEQFMKTADRGNEILQLLADDKQIADEAQRMGEKALAELSVEVQIRTNNAVQQLSVDIARALERQLAKELEAAKPPEPPRLSEHWNYNPFGSMESY